MLIYEKIDQNFTNFVANLCKHTVQFSMQRSFHIVNLSHNFSTTHLEETLHQNSISTTTVNNVGDFVASSSGAQQRNVIFFLEKLDDVLSLILSTAFYGTYPKINTNESAPPFEFSTDLQNGANFVTGSSKSLPRYCVLLDSLPPIGRGALNETCDIQMNAAANEIDIDYYEDESFLSDQVSSYTRGLYVHRIWNPKNRLIFMIVGKFDGEPMGGQETNPGIIDYILNLNFAFMWRFFRGLRAIICLRRKCFKYDPFKKLISHHVTTGENLLSGSLPNLDFTTVRYIYDHNEDGAGDELLLNRITVTILNDALTEFGKKYNGMPVFSKLLNISHYSSFSSKDYEILRKNNIDAFIANGIFSFNIDEFSDYYYTIAVGSNSLCFVTPPSACVPQYLVIFKVFSLLLWTLILITIAMFVTLQFLFQLTQYKALRDLYTDQELLAFEETSVSMAVWSYLMCGSPSCVLLGKLFTGKIIFILLTFFTLIIATVYQSVMFTMLSEYIRYPEIETLEELERSDLLLQVRDYNLLFRNVDFSETLITKFTDTFYYYEDVIYDLCDNEDNSQTGLQRHGLALGKTFLEMNGTMTYNSFEMVLAQKLIAAQKNLRSTVETSAFLLSVPQEFASLRYLLLQTDWMDKPVQVYQTKECILTYPLMYRVLKNTPYFDELNSILTSLVESGAIQRMMDTFAAPSRNLVPGFEVAVDLPRAFSMVDLQAAFLGLLIGLFSSCLVFGLELLTNLIKEMMQSKKLNRRKK